MLWRHRIVDMHSHLGVDSLPGLVGSGDTNSFKGYFFVKSYLALG